jgi:hypothetical protein
MSGAGIAVGLSISLAATRVLSAMLYDTSRMEGTAMKVVGSSGDGKTEIECSSNTEESIGV